MSLIKLLLILFISYLAKSSIIIPSDPPSKQPKDITHFYVETPIQPSQKLDLDLSSTIPPNKAQVQSKLSSSSPIPHPPTPITPNFCQRTIARSSCPNPPTVEPFDLRAYTGTWYQAASTARYKLTFQSGLICEQANYTLLPSNFGGAVRIAAIYSGSAVLSRLEAATLTRFSLSTDRICTAAKTICQQTTSPYSGLRQNLRALWQSISSLSTSHPSIAADLQREIRRTFHLIRVVESGMESLSINVSQIQQAYGSVCSGQGLQQENIRQLTDIISGTLRVVRDISYQIYSRDYIRRQIISIAANLAAESPSLFRQISSSALQIASEFARIEASLTEMGYILTNLEVGSPKLGGPANFGKGFKAVWYGLGFQNFSAPGKLEMDFYGVRSPYWIIGLEGSATEGYRAAMVYSCIEGLNRGIYENLFVLSRSGVVEEEVMARFMEVAGMYGIDVDCNNPLILTDQRGGSCGAQ